MHYVKELTVPAGTASASPASDTIELPAGILQQLSVFFPPGCARMVYVAIYDGTSQVFPKGAGSSYCEDAKEVSVNTFEMFDSAMTYTIKGWAPSTNYQHKITFTFEVKTAEEIAMSRSGYY